MELSRYALKTLVHEGTETVLYRGNRQFDDAPVVVKLTRDEYPSWRALSRLRLEHSILLDLQDIPQIPRVDELVSEGRLLGLVIEDLGPTSLAGLIAARGFLDPITAIAITIPVARALAVLHSRRIIHKDIKPSNIMIDESTFEPHLIDFGIATRLGRETHEAAVTEGLQGTLAYIAPEQTGRMNRPLDSRADLYSLGMTLYEMLTGAPPFSATNVDEAIHAHLAKTPIPPAMANNSVPMALSNIVLKLIAKSPEQRYQSARGLISDLERCQRALVTEEQLETFPLGTEDRLERLVEPAQLLGRVEELRTLGAALVRAQQGATQFVLVKGSSGIGKSAVVREACAYRVEQSVLFAEGKFDSATRATPFAALSTATRAIVHHALRENHTTLEARKQDLTAALGINSQVLVDLCPDFELLLTQKTKAPEVGAAEAKNRLPIMYRRFLSVFASARTPLVLFFDDLQWADPASLELLGRVLTDPELHHTLVIGAYRDDEIDAGHPLSAMLAKLRKASVEPIELTVGPLSTEATNEYIAASLGMAPDVVRTLSQAAWNKTHGNPFFLGQFLRTLVEEGSLHFDLEKRSFVWDLASIDKAEVTENVGALMSRKVDRFSEKTRRVLEVAAAIGPVFPLRALSRILEAPANRIAKDLWPALAEGFVLPLGSDYRYIGDEADVPTGVLERIAYRFLHDRVKEACYGFVSAEARPRLHLTIARELARADDAVDGEKLLELAGHYAIGASIIEDGEEKMRVAKLELRAGKRAMAATAYQAAADFSAVGRKLIGSVKDAGFASDRELGFSLWLLGAESELLVGKFEQAETLLSELLEASETSLEKARVHELRMHAYINQSRYADALGAGVAGLSEFGITFPDTADGRNAAFGQGIGTILGLLGGKPVEELGKLERLEDPAEEQAQKLLGDLAIPTFYVDPSYYGPVVIELVRRSLVIGQTMSSPWGYILLGFLLGAIIGQREIGVAFGRMALSLAEQWKSPMLATRIHITFAGYGYVRESLRSLAPYLVSCRTAAIEAGDFVYLAQASFSTGPILLPSGIALEQTLEELDTCLALVQRTGDVMATGSTKLSRQIYRSLAGKTKSLDSLDEEDFDTRAELAKFNPMEHGGALFYFHSLSSLWHLVNGNAEAALASTAAAEPFAVACMGMFWTIYLSFVAAFARVALARQSGDLEASRVHLEKIDEARTKLKGYVESSPLNFRHRVALLDAAYADAKKEPAWDVLALYDKALELTREADVPYEEALANEFAGRLLLRHNRPQAARGYFTDAYRAYRHWGATAKAQALLEELPDMFIATVAKTKTSSAHDPSQTTARTTLLGHTTTGMLRDASLVLRAVQMIAGELVLSEVIRRLMRIVLENAGAERGALLLARNDVLIVEAKFQASPEQVEVGLEQPLENDSTLAAQPILHAFRTRNNLLLDDVQADIRFASDAYVMSKLPRSILCLPITHQGRTAGVLYLETRAVEGAFTAVRVELLGLLASQAAVAIQNAMMVEEIRKSNVKLEEDVRGRTVEIEKSNAELMIANQRLAEQLEERAQAEKEREALREQILDGQKARLAELSAPLLPITADVLVMPIIGSVDAERANAIMDTALQGVQRHSARAMILDVTGMRQIDTQALSALLLVANALRLLGTRPLLTGVRPEVAQTIIGLGASLDGLETLSTLQAGIARVIRSSDATRKTPVAGGRQAKG